MRVFDYSKKMYVDINEKFIISMVDNENISDRHQFPKVIFLTTGFMHKITLEQSQYLLKLWECYDV